MGGMKGKSRRRCQQQSKHVLMAIVITKLQSVSEELTDPPLPSFLSVSHTDVANL